MIDAATVQTTEPESESPFERSLRKGSLSDIDQEILALIHSVPQKTSNTYTDIFCLYQKALRIYQAVSIKKLPCDVGIHLPDRSARRKVYQLVFDALYHHEVLQDLLVESSFYSRNFDMLADEALLHIMLFDFQDSKFTLRLRNDREEGIPENVARVANALWNHRTKLNATLARMRVESDALKICQLIPDPVSRQVYEVNCRYPCYARINPIKVRDVQTEVVKQLLNEGVVLVKEQNELHRSPKSMCLLTKDLLVFSAGCRNLLDAHNLVGNGFLVIQDFPSYKFVNGIRHKIEMCSGDVVVTECNSGVEVAHIATILGYRGTVLVYNSTQLADIEQIQDMLRSLEVSNVKFMDTPFVCASSDEETFDDTQMIVCLSTLSSATPYFVGHRVDYALQQDHRLPVMLQPPKQGEKVDLEDRSLFYTSLSSALLFDQVEYIILAFSKDSTSNIDSEGIAKKLLEQYNTRAERVGLKSFVISTGTHHSVDNMECFTISIQREPDRPPTPPRDVIDRAIANGILDGEGINERKVTPKKRGKGKRKGRFRIPFHHHGIPMTIAAQQKVVQKKDKEITSAKKIFRV